MKLSKVLPFLIILGLAFSAGWTPGAQLPANQAAGVWGTAPNVQQGRYVQRVQAEKINVADLPSSSELVPLAPKNATPPLGLAFSQAEYASLKQQAAAGNMPGPQASNVQMDPADLDAAAFRKTPSQLAPVGSSLYSFPGPTKATTGDWVLPDASLAVGPDAILACVNSSFVGYSKTGTQLFNIPFNLWFISQTGGDTSIFDPICKYDKLSNRFIMVAMVHHASPLMSKYLVSVTTGSAIGNWLIYSFDATLDGETPTSFWADFPDVGIDNNAIYITSNQFDNSNVFQYSKIRILNKSALYAGTTPGWFDFWDIANNPPAGGAAFSLRAAHNLSPNDIEYFVNSLPGSGSQLSTYRIQTPLTAPTLQTSATGTPVTPYSLPPNAVQPGTATLIDTGDARLLNAVMQNGSLWTAQTVSSGGGTPRACFQWYQLDPLLAALTQQGTFCSSDSSDYFYPAVTLDSLGNMGVTFSSVSSITFATMRYTGRRTATALNTLESSADVVAGLGPHTSGRWGSYGGAAIDPNGCMMWFIHEFAGNTTTTDWRTQIFSATYSPVNVTIGGALNGSYCLTSGQSTRQSFAVNNGPVRVDTAGVSIPILAAQRLLYYGTGISPTSFVEMMGLPAGQLDTTYWFPWYKNDGIVDTQIRIGNVSGSTATVHIYIAGVEVTGSPFTLTTSGAGQSQRLSFALNDGPVKVVSNVQIVTTERLIYFDSGAPISFSEMLGLPNSQLSTTYWFPWYKNIAGDIDTQLRIGNVSGATATVHIYVGGVEMTGSPFTLTAGGAGQSTRLNFAGINNGPVKIVSNQNIVAAERILYYASGLPTSFVETMGLPNGSLNTTQWFPWYKNDGIVDTQLRIGNVSGAAASVHVYIGTTEMAGSPFALTATGAGQSLRLSFTVNDGPVKLVSDQNIVTSERLIYFDSGVPISFSEMLGLPDSQLSNAYWLPWYKNVGELDTQLRFGVP